MVRTREYKARPDKGHWDKVQWAIGVIVALALALPASVLPTSARAAPLTPDQQALHVLNRIAYGPRPGDVDRIKAMGIDRYIDQQLNPERIPESPELTRRLQSLTTLHMSPIQLFDRYEPHAVNGRRPTKDEAKKIREQSRVILREAVEARILRSVGSEQRLQEVMTDFWFNHFNIFAGKGLDRIWIGAFEEQAIRPYALGHFRDLLGATARHPAMLFYLDNWQNTAPDSPGARGKEQGLNENYAREIMELHTLGVDGGYTQDDVIALARIFTGWGLPQGLRLDRASGNGFTFDARRHDTGTKQFLGQTIRSNGVAEGEQAMDILARSPKTAHHIAFQLAQYFVADQPDPALVDVLTKRYLDTDGDIREVMRTLLKSPQFWDPANVGHKFKTPYDYVMSSVRLSGIEVADVRPIAGQIAQLGMPIYGYQTPDGYKNTSDAWLNADAMNRRLNFATALGTGRTRIDDFSAVDEQKLRPAKKAPPLRGNGAAVDDPPHPLDASRLKASLGDQLSPKTEQAIASAAPPLRAGMVLGSPEFMNR
jgi:uncharacterized protein (DUF1800 family)